jgi:hypothetical protein
MTTRRRPLRPPPEPHRTSIPMAELVELERHTLKHGVTAVFYARKPRRSRTAGTQQP